MTMDTRYDHTKVEEQLKQEWEKKRVYSLENNPGPVYSIDTPPPTVSGSLHIGHIFSYTQTDIIARYKRMSGQSVFYPFGFDDNGLPTERFVEKKTGIRPHTVGRDAFIALCLQETASVEHAFKELWQRMGLSIEWEYCYSTISDSTRKIAQESFIDLYKKGYVYRAFEPALYCTTCRTSVAQAELDDSEQASTFNDIVFFDEKDNQLIVGTTRPELLFSCVALLYNPADARYQHLQGTSAQVPLAGHKVPVLADETVTIDKGTGLVMCCTFGDKMDIVWYKKHGFAYKQSVGLDGKFVASTGPLAGLSCQDARKTVISLLQTQGLLLAQKPIVHAVQVHERCKKEIEYVVLSQWFLKVLPYKKELIALADKIAWHPSFMKARYTNWVEHLSWDWCLSRQRYFGIPFPVWYCASCNHQVLAPQESLPVDPQTYTYTQPCPSCGHTIYTPDTDVMDTWNTSSLTPYLCYQYLHTTEGSVLQDAQKKQFIPMGMRPQAHDIIRTWAFYTITKVWMHNGTIPWKDIVISGHVLTDANKKISKSQGGAKLTPEALLETYPADAIRFWTASASLGYDVAFSENQLKIGTRLVTKLWNAFRFSTDYTKDVKLHAIIDEKELGSINQWLLHRASACFADYDKNLKEYEFGLALQRIETFFWADFCDTYIELVKHQLCNVDLYSPESTEATRWTLYTVGLSVLQMYAPYVPFVTEALYQQLYAEKLGVSSLHMTKYGMVQRHHLFAEGVARASSCIELVNQVRKLKTLQKLSLKTPLERLTVISKSRESMAYIAEHETLLKGVTQAKELVFTQEIDCVPGMYEQESLWYASIEL